MTVVQLNLFIKTNHVSDERSNLSIKAGPGYWRSIQQHTSQNCVKTPSPFIGPISDSFYVVLIGRFSCGTAIYSAECCQLYLETVTMKVTSYIAWGIICMRLLQGWWPGGMPMKIRLNLYNASFVDMLSCFHTSDAILPPNTPMKYTCYIPHPHAQLEI